MTLCVIYRLKINFWGRDKIENLCHSTNSIDKEIHCLKFQSHFGHYEIENSQF